MQRRKQVQLNYLEGRARGPYAHTPVLNQSFIEDREAGPSTSTPGERNENVGQNVCYKCEPVLSRYKDIFSGMVHQGSELKLKKSSNPHPKRDMKHYRDMNAQNLWLRNNV